jgi:hypothetical protein
MRRFFAPDKEKCEAFLRAQKNVVEQNTTKAQSADWCFAEPEPPTGGEALTVCYAKYHVL